MINKEILKDLFRREKNSNKYTNGHCFIIGGSIDYTGAVILSGQAAFRTGAGMVTLGIPRELKTVYAVKCLEEIILGLPSTGGYINKSAAKIAGDYIGIKKVTSLVIGPGLSGKECCRDFLLALLEKIKGVKIPVIIDAEAIYHLKSYIPEDLKIILTPHEGELSKYLGIKREDINKERKKYAFSAARKIKGICILKGPETIMTDGLDSGIDHLGTPILATAGSGDVLSGILGGIFSGVRQIQDKKKILQMVSLAVTIHSLTGILSGKEKKYGVIAGDLIAQIGRAIHKLRKEGR